MYYISKILLDGYEVSNIRTISSIDYYDIKVRLTDMQTRDTIIVDSRNLNGNEFGVVNESLFSVSDELWRFLDYVDKPEVVESNPDAINVLNFIDYKPVDDNCIFWRRLKNEAHTPVASALNLLDLYEYVFRNYDNITDKTDVHVIQYSCRHRLCLNKNVIRYITKLVTLRR